MSDTPNPNPWEALQAEAAADPEAAPVALDDAGAFTPHPAAPAPDAIDDPPPGIPYEWAGRTWRLKPQFDLRVVVALRSGDFGRALGLLIGKAQTAALLDLDSDEPFTDDVLKDMVERVAKSNGTSLPE